MGEFFNQKDIISIILGGTLTLLGGVLGNWLQIRYAHKIKMDEIITERKITTSAEAFAHTKKIQSMFLRSSSNDVLKEILALESWWLKNRLFLPGSFIDKWLGIREGAAKLTRLEKSANTNPEVAINLQKELDRLSNEAIKEIYDYMGVKEIKVDLPRADNRK